MSLVYFDSSALVKLLGQEHGSKLATALSQKAGELAAAASLRGADVVHPASALAVGSPDTIVGVWDRSLGSAAMNLDVPVVPTP